MYSTDGRKSVADLLGRIERLLEHAVEGTSSRLFRARLQPVQLAKAASRALEAQQLIGPDGPEVPNQYRIALNPTDFAQFSAYQQSLQTQIERYLDRFAADRGLRPVAAWRVEVVADEGVRPRAVGVDARMADVDAPSAAPPGAVRVPERAVPAPEPRPAGPVGSAVLMAEDGRQLSVRRDVTTLGRALDNHVVIADSRVSRHHAEILRDGETYGVRDLGSTNGTAVAGRRVGQQRLADGDEISLGGFKLVFRWADA